MKETSYVFIAGGIGITPFRSIIHQLLAERRKTDIILLYQDTSLEDFLFTDLFQNAEKTIRLKTKYFATATHSGITEQAISSLHSYQSRMYYLSGPLGFIEAVRKILTGLGISPDQIKEDIFTGYS